MRTVVFAALLVVVDLAGACRKHEVVPGREPPATKEIPVAVHLLHFNGAPNLTTQTSDSEARRLVAEASRIWSAAGISLVVDSVRSEEAVPDPVALGWFTTSHDDEGPGPLIEHLRPLRPPVPAEPKRLHVYFIGTLPANGITISSDAIFVQDQPHLMEVAGGGREPRARVMAHEIGHTLSLGHADQADQLMFGGSTGVRLSEREIAIVRSPMVKQRREGWDAYDLKQYARCGELWREVARQDRSNEDAYNAGCCFALAGNADRAFEVLSMAMDLGFKDANALQDPELASLRNDPRWKPLVARVPK